MFVALKASIYHLFPSSTYMEANWIKSGAYNTRGADSDRGCRFPNRPGDLNLVEVRSGNTTTNSVRHLSNRPCWKPREGIMKECLLLLFLLAIGGGLNTAEGQSLPVRVGYTALSGAFSPLWVAKELDLFERQRLQCTPIYMAATLAYQAMLAGETDFVVGTGIAPAQARLGGADPLVLATYISGFNFSVIARPPVQQPGDLRGKRIGVNRFGAGTDFGARIALKQWGLAPVKDVTIIQLGGYPEAFAGLKGDSVQAAVLAPPFSTEAKRLGMVELLDFNESDIEFTGVGLATTARFMTTHDEATRRVVRALVEGIWAFKGNRQAALRTLGKYTRTTDRSLLEETYQTYRKGFRLVPRTTEAGVRNVLEALADQNPKARSANAQDFYTNRFIDALEQTGFMRELAARYPEALH
jgi:NitT/TauT family transport system substrate-binding protein